MNDQKFTPGDIIMMNVMKAPRGPVSVHLVVTSDTALSILSDINSMIINTGIVSVCSTESSIMTSSIVGVIKCPEI